MKPCSSCRVVGVSLLLCLSMVSSIAMGRMVSSAEAGKTALNFKTSSEVAAFVSEMVSEHNFDRENLQKIFSHARYSASAIKPFQRKAASPTQSKAKPRKKDWREYRARFLKPATIYSGLWFWYKHEDNLRRAEEIYGVPAEIIVAILGVETRYGKNTGGYRVFDALATLAFAYPDVPKRDARMTFFRKELAHLLIYARENGENPMVYRGSYAGAIGFPQFMPSSIRTYAVDFNSDGKIDLQHSPVDAIGSVANYLFMHGWAHEEQLVYSANVDKVNVTTLDSLINSGLVARYLPAELRQKNLMIESPLPSHVRFGLVDLQNGDAPTQYWVVTNNYFAITHYNRSYFYAMAVVDLARAVREKHDFLPRLGDES